MKVDYSSIQPLVKRGETVFPFGCFGAVMVDWAGVGEYLMTLQEWDK